MFNISWQFCNQEEPHVNVAHNPAANFDEKLAANWVKYANVTKKYGVKYDPS